MPIEAALIKPVVDALMALFRQSEHVQLQRNAEAALREAIRELLLANPDENKAAGILSEDVVLAEDMLSKHRATRASTRGKGTSHKPRKPAAARAAEPAAATKPKKKPAAKKR